MSNLRYKSWIDDVAESFVERHGSAFYKDNPVLSMNSIIAWEPISISACKSPECCEGEDRYLLTQIAMFTEGRVCTYRHIVGEEYHEIDNAAYIAVDVPFWRRIEDCNRQLMIIRQREREILSERKMSGLRLPRLIFLNEYLSLSDMNTDDESAVEDCVCSGDGDKVRKFACDFLRVMELCRVAKPLWANSYCEASRVMAINMVVNQYWLSHLLCGQHSHYESNEQLKKATVASLHGQRSLLNGIDGVPHDPTLYVVYVRTLPGVNRALSYVNEAVMEMCGKGSVSHPRIGNAYWWKIQQVDSTGTALMLHGKIMQISDVQVEKHPVLGQVRRILERLTVCLPHVNASSNGTRSMPFVAVVPVQCAAPTGDCQIVEINDPSLRVDDLPVSAYVIRKFGFDRGD